MDFRNTLVWEVEPQLIMPDNMAYCMRSPLATKWCVATAWRRPLSDTRLRPPLGHIDRAVLCVCVQSCEMAEIWVHLSKCVCCTKAGADAAISGIAGRRGGGGAEESKS